MAEDSLDINEIKDLRDQVGVLKSQCLANSVPEIILQQVEGLEVVLEKFLEKADEQPGMSAQVSIYPLRRKSLSPVIDSALNVFKKQGLGVTPGSMSTVITGNEGAIWNALRSAFHAATVQGETVMIITISNACPILDSEST